MKKRLILDHDLLDIVIRRLCRQLTEHHDDFSSTVVLGLQPRGVYLAKRIVAILSETLGKEVPLGLLDATFFRDDFRRKDAPLLANENIIPFEIEDKKVILIDDVLFTGRTVRAALNAITSFGRPAQVELLVLINRKYCRDLPIEPMYVGKDVHTLVSEKVLVELAEQTGKKDGIWLIPTNH